MDALERMLNTLIYILPIASIFTTEFCKRCSIQIFNTYVQCHLSPPEGLRRIDNKNLSEEEIDAEDDEKDDKKKFKDQLQIIGKRYRELVTLYDLCIKSPFENLYNCIFDANYRNVCQTSTDALFAFISTTTRRPNT